MNELGFQPVGPLAFGMHFANSPLACINRQLQGRAIPIPVQVLMGANKVLEDTLFNYYTVALHPAVADPDIKAEFTGRFYEATSYGDFLLRWTTYVVGVDDKRLPIRWRYPFVKPIELSNG